MQEHLRKWRSGPRKLCHLRVQLKDFGTTSGHLRTGNFVRFPCKRHQTKHLVFFPTCFASRGAGVRASLRPPSIHRYFVLSKTVFARMQEGENDYSVRYLNGLITATPK